MNRLRAGRVWMGVMIAVLGTFAPMACKRQSPAEKDLADRLTGTWEWKQPGAPQPTVVVLELTAKGRYTETTYRETGGQRRLLYVKRATNELMPEPADAEAIAKLTKSGFQPALETGRFRVSMAEKTQFIVFEGDKLTKVEKSEGRGLREQPLIISSVDRVTIAGRPYQRQAAPRPK